MTREFISGFLMDDAGKGKFFLFNTEDATFAPFAQIAMSTTMTMRKKVIWTMSRTNMGLTMILKSDMMTIMRMNTTMKRLMSLRKNRQ